MALSKRSRSISLPGDGTDFAYTRLTIGPSSTTKSAGRTTYRLKGTQYTESEGHPFPYKSRKAQRRGKLMDVGGPFYTVKRYALMPPAWPVLSRVVKNPSLPAWRDEESGTSYLPLCLPVTFFDSIPKPPAEVDPYYSNGDQIRSLKLSAFPTLPSEGDLDALGASAIARCKPTRSPADLSTAIAELTRDGLPSLVGASFGKENLSRLKQLSQEHLNYQFGIKPVVSDIQKTAATFANMDDLTSQFERDAGKVVRRRYYFPTERTSSTRIITQNTTVIGQGANGFGLKGPYPNILVIEKVTTIRRWFSGAFTYTLPKGINSRSILGEIRLKADRLGLDPDLDTIWNAAPWTWLGDWFSNAGDFVSNVNDVAKYGLVLKYGYLMTHIRVTETYTCPNLRAYSTTIPGSSSTPPPPVTLVTESKRRTPATPFGFGFDMSSLNGMQQSILAALGISRR